MDEASVFAYIFVAFLSTYSLHRYYTKRIGLNKIKSYLDNRESSIQEKYDNKLRNLEDATINFDVDLKKYEQFSKIVTNELSQIEKKIFLFEEIDNRLNGRIREYAEQKEAMDGVVAELKNKIDYFKSNEDMFHRLRNDLSDSTIRLEKLDNNLIFLEKQYEKRLSEKVQEYDLVLEEDLRHLKKSLENKLEEHEGDMQKKSSGVKLEFEILLKEWTNMREQSERIFKEEQEILFNSIKGEADVFYDEEKKEIRSLLDEIRGDLEHSSGEIDLKIGELENKQNRLLEKSVKLEEDIEKNRQVILDRTSDVSEEILKQLKQNVGDYQKELMDEMSGKQVVLNKEIEKMKKSLNDVEKDVVNEVNHQFSNIQESVKEYEQKLSAQVEETEFKYNELKEEYFNNGKRELEDLRSGFDKLAEVKDKLLEDQNNQKDLYTSHADFIKERSQTMIDLEGEFKGEIGNKTKSLENFIEASFNNMGQLTEDSKDELLGYKRELMVSLNEQLDQEFKVETANIKKDIDGIKIKRDEKIKDFYEFLNENKSQLLKEFENRLSQVDEKYQKGLRELEEKSNQTSKQLIDIEKVKKETLDIEGKVRSEMSLVRDNFKYELNEFKEEVEENRKEIKENQGRHFVELSNEAKEEQKNLFDSIKSETDVFLNEEIEKIKQSLSDVETDVAEKVNHQFGNIQESVKEYKQRLFAQVEETEFKYNELKEEYFNNGKRELEDLRSGFDKLAEVKDKLLEDQNNQKDLYTSHADFIKERSQTMIDLEGEFKGEIGNKTKSLENFIEASFNNLGQLTEDSKDELLGYKRELMVSLNEQLDQEFKVETANIKKDIDGIKIKRDEKIKDFYEFLNENKSQLLKEFENRLSQVDEKYQKGLRELEDKSNQTSKQLIDIERVKKETLEIEGKVRSEMSLVRDDFKYELNEFKKEVEEDRKGIKESQGRHFVELSNEANGEIKKIKNDLGESIELIKREADEKLREYLKQLDMEVSGSKSFFADMSGKVNEDLEKSFVSFKKEFKRKLISLNKEVEKSNIKLGHRFNKMDKAANDYVVDLENRVARYENKLKKNWSDLDKDNYKKINELIIKVKHDSENQISLISQNENLVNKIKNDFEKKLFNLNNKYESMYEKNSIKITEILRTCEKLKKDFGDDLETNLSNQIKEVSNKMAKEVEFSFVSFKKDFEEKLYSLDQAASRLNAKQGKNSSHLDKITKEHKIALEKKLASLDKKLDKNWKSLDSNNNKKINELTKEIKNDYQKHVLLISKNADSLSNVKDNFNTELLSLNKKYEDLYQENSAKVKNMMSLCDKLKEGFRVDLGNHLSHQINEVSNNLKSFKHSIETSLTNIEEDMDAKIKERLYQLENEVNGSSKFFADMSEKVNKNIESSFISFKKEFEKKLHFASNELSDLNIKKDKRFIKLDKMAENYAFILDKKLTALDKRLEKNWEDLDKDNDKKISDLIKEVKSDYQNQALSISKNADLLNKIKMDFHEELASLNEKYDDLYKENLIKINDLLTTGEKLKENFGYELKDYLSNQKKDVVSDLESFKYSLQTSFNKDEEIIKKKVDAFSNKINLSDKEVEKMIEKRKLELNEIKNSINNIEKQLDEKIEKIADQYDSNIGDFFQDKENVFYKEWGKIEKSLETKGKELSKKTEKHFSDFDGRIEKASAKMEKYADQVELFKKVDTLSIRLSNDLKGYSEKIDDLNNESKNFEKLDIKMKEMKRLAEESKALLYFVRSEKDNVHSASLNIKELLDQCTKINTMSSKMDDNMNSLDVFDKKIKEHVAMTQKALEQVSTITKDKKIVEEISQWIASLEKKKKELLLSYNSLDKKVELSSEKQLDINDRLNEIEDKSLLIGSNHKKILEFNNRYDNLEIALADVEQRQKSIEKLKVDLAVDKSSILEIKNDLNDQIKMALTLRDDKMASVRDGDKLNHSQTAEMVKALYGIGWSKEDIAKHLKKDIFEIDIYLKK